MRIELIPLGHEIFANCYLLIDEKSGDSALIDPGWYSKEAEKFVYSHGDINLKYILLTHGHFDHILGVHGFKHASRAAVSIHSADADELTDPVMTLCEVHFPKSQTPVNADILLKDGDAVQLGDEKIKVMHTPGHTSGSVCFILENDRTIISGDTLFCRTVGRTDFADGSDEEMYNSIKKLLSLDGDYRVLPGHNRETTLDSERTRNIYIRRMGR